MNFTIKTGNIVNVATPVLVLGVFDDHTLPLLTERVDNATHKTLSRILKAGDIKGKIGDVLLLQKIEGCRAQRILLVGCGKAKDLDAKKFNKILKHTCKALQKHQLAAAAGTLVALPIKDVSIERKAQLLAQCFVTGQYHYTTTKPKAGKQFVLDTITLLLTEAKDRAPAQRGLDAGAAIGKGMNVARELGNLPGNVCTPTYLGKQALQLAKKHKQLSTQVLSEAQMKRLGMHSLLSVGHGSPQSSALIVMQYRGAPAAEKSRFTSRTVMRAGRMNDWESAIFC